MAVEFADEVDYQNELDPCFTRICQFIAYSSLDRVKMHHSVQTKATKLTLGSIWKMIQPKQSGKPGISFGSISCTYFSVIQRFLLGFVGSKHLAEPVAHHGYQL